MGFMGSTHALGLSSIRRVVVQAAAVMCAGLSMAAVAHDVPPSVVMLDIGRHKIDVELQLPLNELGTALSEPLAANPAGVIAEHGPQIADYVRRHFHISSGDGPFQPVLQGMTLRHTGNPNWTSNDWLVVKLQMASTEHADKEVFSIDDDVILDPVVTHKSLVFVRRDLRNGLLGEAPRPIGLIAFQQTHLPVDGSGGSWWSGVQKLFRLGISHIAHGTDHLLFLLVLLLPAPLIARAGRWLPGKDVRASLWSTAGIVSGFTVGHSITLAIGALEVLSIPAQWVEVLIAASILVSALHAWRPVFAGKEVYLASGFGLIHGLAFASALAGLRFDGWTLALSLLGFNLGIEVMQLAIVVLVVPWLLLISRTRLYTPVRVVGAGCAAIAALGWILERAFNMPNAIAMAVEVMSRHPGILLALLALSAALAQARSFRHIRQLSI